jgi:V8-like Glu-specific endopeptidase
MWLWAPTSALEILMQTHARSALFIAALSTLGLSNALAAPACDERIDITNPDRVPFQWIVGQRQDSDLDGAFNFISSGTLVGPHLVLTCGHCVYNRNNGHKALGSFTVVPAMHRDNASGLVVYPHGSRVVSLDSHKVTNSKWTDPNYSPESGVDYGGLKIVCPFEDITTYMPLVFDVVPGFVNMSGYPTEDLPAPGTTLDQYRDAGDVTNVQSRILTYDVRSTGGASGAPVWLYSQADGRRMVAVNRGHSTQCNGLGPRLVWNNESLISDWLAWRPSAAESLACATARSAGLSFADLREIYTGGQRELLSRQQLGLDNVPAVAQGQPKQRVYQWIENTFYAWEEFAGANGGRHLRMTEPHQGLMSINDARVLLSASQSWQGQVASGRYTEFGANLSEKPLPGPASTGLDGDRPDPTLDR